VRRLVKQVVGRLGYDIVRRGDPAHADTTSDPPVIAQSPVTPSARACPADIDATTMETYDAVREFTMTSPERVAALCAAVRYISRHEVPGDLVECGVWRGGSMLAAARTLLEQGDYERTLWLYDTFAGMSEPTEVDRRDNDGTSAADLLASHDRTTDLWAISPLDEVKRVMAQCAYPVDRIRYVQGNVEDTIPAEAPQRIAVLRLDTDWYESTHHELVHLLPRVSPGGVLIVDDYGFWQGARRAVDEYLDATNIRLLLNRIDDTGRIAVLPG
jgi:O-methyltransferase